MDERKKRIVVLIATALIVFVVAIASISNNTLEENKVTIEKSVLDEACKEIFNNTDAVFVEQDGVATKLECEILEDKNG